MKLLADVNVDRGIVEGLREDGHDVEWLTQTGPRLEDSSLMERAYTNGQIIRV